MQPSFPTNNGRISAMEDSRDYQQQQRFVAEDKSQVSMVRTRGSAAAGTVDDGLGEGAATGASANKNSLAGESGEQRKINKDSYYSAPAMQAYRDGTPPQEQQHWQQYISTTSNNISVPQGNVEERQPPSPMVTPPTRSNAASQAAKKSPPISAAGVPHVYHDYSRVPDETNFVRKKTGGVTQPFPEKLHEMLDAVEGTAETSIVSWLPHGRAFLVRKPKEFTERIMPKYFRQTKLTSFQRQLNLYGFRRITQGTDAGAYYHEMFLKARPVLCQRMARQKVKGTGHKQPADAKTEPNFYLMPPVESGLAGSGSPPQHSFGSSTGIVGVTGFGGMNTFDGSAGLPPAAASSNQYEYPASPGLHGAAHLLQGIASGYNTLRLPQAPLLGQPAPATTRPQDEDSNQDQQQQQPGSFLQPRLTNPSSYESV